GAPKRMETGWIGSETSRCLPLFFHPLFDLRLVAVQFFEQWQRGQTARSLGDAHGQSRRQCGAVKHLLLDYFLDLCCLGILAAKIELELLGAALWAEGRSAAANLYVLGPRRVERTCFVPLPEFHAVRR